MEDVDWSAELEGLGVVLGKIYSELRRANKLKALELKGKSHRDNINPVWVDEVFNDSTAKDR